MATDPCIIKAEYYTISNITNTLEIYNTNNLTTKQIIDLLFFLQYSRLEQFKIKTLILYDLFDVNNVNNYDNSVNDKRVDHTTNIVLLKLMSMLMFSKNIEYLEIKNLECFMDYNVILKKYSVDAVISFLKTLNKTNIKVLVIDNFKTNEPQNGKQSESMDLFVKTFNELNYYDNLIEIKVNDKYYKTTQYIDKTIQKIITSFKIDNTNMRLLLNLNNLYQTSLTNKLIENVDMFIEKINLILDTFNVTIDDFKFIESIIIYYNKYYINQPYDFNLFVKEINEILTKLNIAINNEQLLYYKIYEIYFYYRNIDIFKNIDEFINETINIKNKTGLDITANKNNFCYFYNKVITYKKRKELILDENAYFDNLLKLFDNIETLTINLSVLDEQLCMSLYKNSYNKLITCLNIKTNIIINIIYIYELLKTNKNIKKLILNSVEFTEIDLDFLTNIIKHSSITELQLLHCKMNSCSNKMKRIYHSMKKNTLLTNITIMLHNSNSVNVDIYYLFKIINKFEHVKLTIPSSLNEHKLFKEYLTNENKSRIIFVDDK